jgi:GNAT superfamily N-acetyltransferase
MDSDLRILPAREADLPHLPELERLAGERFRGWGVADELFEETTPLEDFREAQEEGLVWVAVRSDAPPVGFALVEVLAGSVHLEELDVHPDHGRRGAGAALVAAVIEFADSLALPVSLTTFRDVPWNAPFYSRLGFAIVEPADLSDELRDIVGGETERGLEEERRVVMQRGPN